MDIISPRVVGLTKALEIVSLMAIRAEGDVIVRVSPILSVDIGPVDTLRSRAWLSAVRALCGNTLHAAEPVMKSAISSLIALPVVMVGAASHGLWMRPSPGRLALYKTGVPTTLLDHLVSDRLIAFGGAIRRGVAIGPVCPAWVCRKQRATCLTSSRNHAYMIRILLVNVKTNLNGWRARTWPSMATP